MAGRRHSQQGGAPRRGSILTHVDSAFSPPGRDKPKPPYQPRITAQTQKAAQTSGITPFVAAFVLRFHGIRPSVVCTVLSQLVQID